MIKRVKAKKTLQQLVNERFGFRPRMSKAQIRRQVLEGVEKFSSAWGYDNDQRRVAWFVKFANAKTGSLKNFWTDARYLASTKGVEGKQVALPSLKKTVRNTLRWATEPEQKGTVCLVVSSSGLKGEVSSGRGPAVGILTQSSTLRKVGNKIEQVHWAHNFEGAILSSLYNLLGSDYEWFGRCAVCESFFARKGWGRQFYCRTACQQKTADALRPPEYFKRRQADRRRKIRELEENYPDLAAKVTNKELTLLLALKEKRRRLAGRTHTPINRS